MKFTNSRSFPVVAAAHTECYCLCKRATLYGLLHEVGNYFFEAVEENGDPWYAIRSHQDDIKRKLAHD